MGWDITNMPLCENRVLKCYKLESNHRFFEATYEPVFMSKYETFDHDVK